MGWAFAQYSQILAEAHPTVPVSGDNYPPPGFRLQLAHIIGALKMAVLMMLALSFNPWTYFGQEVLGPTPKAYLWALDNKIFACMVIFFCANLVETQLISTGAFEVSVGGSVVWSKLETGRVPQPRELLQIINNKLNTQDERVREALAGQL